MNLKKILPALFLLLNFSLLFSSEFPAEISESSVISIININYSVSLKSIFSKACLRIYDKENSFDELIDYSSFKNFEDPLFPLKFYLHPQKAKITSEPFSKALNKEKTADISEQILNLSFEEKKYIFSFVKQLKETIPDYTYDFDLINNNSFTHIATLLTDCQRYFQTNDHSYFETSKFLHPVNAKTTVIPPVKLYKFDDYRIQIPSYKLFSKNINLLLLVLNLILMSVSLLLTGYQTIVYFKPKYYRSSVNHLIQSYDFILLFFSGFVGLIIFIQFLFSNQIMFRNNFLWLVFNPLNLFMAFKLYFPLHKAKFEVIFWTFNIISTVLYFTFYSFIKWEIPVSVIFSSLPLFFRILYFEITSLFNYNALKPF